MENEGTEFDLHIWAKPETENQPARRPGVRPLAQLRVPQRPQEHRVSRLAG